MSDLYIVLLEASYFTTDNSIFSSSARVEQKCCCELFLVKLVLRVVRHGLEFTAALDSHEICFLFHKIWVMHFSLPAAKFNLFVKIKERCLYFQSSFWTGYSKKLCSFLSLKAFKTEKNKAPSNLTKCLSFQQEVGLQTSWHLLQYELCHPLFWLLLQNFLWGYSAILRKWGEKVNIQSEQYFVKGKG